MPQSALPIPSWSSLPPSLSACVWEAGAVVSLQFGGKNYAGIKQSLLTSLFLIGGITLLINILVILGIHPIIRLLQTPPELEEVMYDYLIVIFLGLPGTFLYNYYAYLLRAVGNSVIPLLFLAVSVVLNIGLDFLFILGFQWGVNGGCRSYRRFTVRCSHRALLLYPTPFPAFPPAKIRFALRPEKPA